MNPNIEEEEEQQIGIDELFQQDDVAEPEAPINVEIENGQDNILNGEQELGNLIDPIPIHEDQDSTDLSEGVLTPEDELLQELQNPFLFDNVFLQQPNPFLNNAVFPEPLIPFPNDAVFVELPNPLPDNVVVPELHNPFLGELVVPEPQTPSLTEMLDYLFKRNLKERFDYETKSRIANELFARSIKKHLENIRTKQAEMNRIFFNVLNEGERAKIRERRDKTDRYYDNVINILKVAEEQLRDNEHQNFVYSDDEEEDELEIEAFESRYNDSDEEQDIKDLEEPYGVEQAELDKFINLLLEETELIRTKSLKAKIERRIISIKEKKDKITSAYDTLKNHVHIELYRAQVDYLNNLFDNSIRIYETVRDSLANLEPHKIELNIQIEEENNKLGNDLENNGSIKSEPSLFKPEGLSEGRRDLNKSFP